MARKTVATPFPRREFLRRAGLATGGLLAGSLACGRSGQRTCAHGGGRPACVLRMAVVAGMSDGLPQSP